MQQWPYLGTPETSKGQDLYKKTILWRWSRLFLTSSPGELEIFLKTYLPKIFSWTDQILSTNFQVDQRLSSYLSGQFKYESDNKFIDLSSYWEKIKENSLDSLMNVYPFMSSIRYSSARLSINPSYSEIKHAQIQLDICKYQYFLKLYYSWMDNLLQIRLIS